MWFTPTKTTNNNKVKYDKKMATKKLMRYLQTTELEFEVDIEDDTFAKVYQIIEGCETSGI